MKTPSKGIYLRGGVYYFRYKDRNEKWREHSTGKTTEGEAYVAKAEFMRQLEGDLIPRDKTKLTLQQAVEKWLEDRKVRIAPSSYRSEVCITKVLLDFLGRETKLYKIADIEVIQRYQKNRVEGGFQAPVKKGAADEQAI